MKSPIFLALVCLPLLSSAADEKPGPDAVVVKSLNKALPLEENKKSGFLWNNFANKPEEQKFNSYGTDKWKDTFAIFAKKLVQKADDQKFDSTSLRKALDLVLKDSNEKIAYLPVGAYQTTLDGKRVWVITVKWEYPSMGRSAGLGHIRMFAFDQETLKRVGFITCS